jgi:hypothetical protein
MLVAALEVVTGLIVVVGIAEVAPLTARGYKSKHYKLIAKRLAKISETTSKQTTFAATQQLEPDRHA